MTYRCEHQCNCRLGDRIRILVIDDALVVLVSKPHIADDDVDQFRLVKFFLLLDILLISDVSMQCMSSKWNSPRIQIDIHL